MDYSHLPLFSGPPISTKEQALAQVGRNADTEWKDAALKSIQHRARHCASVSANDVFADLEQLGIRTHENRAIGAIFLKAARNGWITKTDRTIPSTRKTRHHGDVRVWSSCIHQVPA